ncbi:MAG TPA: TonB-dependent receptor, partial [Pyrinomonadaceae bacterium]|nr:TonB-dependent receptor [Pyrinomonadaceae bacterium]
MKVLAVILLVASGIFAQRDGTISGLVMINDQPAANAQVTLTSKQNVVRSTVSDAGGKYEFVSVPAGEYEITAQLNASTTRIITVLPNQTLTIDLDLRLDARRAGTPMVSAFVTVAADANQTVDHVSKTIDIIEPQELRDRADFALIETLRTIPGFRVQQLGGFGRTATIKTRGLRNQDTAILIDGIRFRDASSITGDASAFLGDFTLTSVSRVEVLRGSGSSLYGTNAIGGTIDFQTARPTRGFHGQLSTAIGGLGLRRFRGNLSDGTSNGKFGFTLGVSRTAYTEGIDGDDNSHNTNFQSRIEFSPTARTHLSGRFFVSDAFVRLNAGPDTLGMPPVSNFGVITARPGVNFIFDVDDPDSVQNSKFFNGQLVLTHVFSEKLLFEGSYSGLKTSRKNDDGPLGPGFQSAATSIFDGTIQTANAHVNWIPAPINQLTAGYEFENEKYGNDGRTPDAAGNFFTRAFQSSHTVYVQDMLQLFDRRLQLAGGFRAQFFKLDAPRFGVNNAPYSDVSLTAPPAAYTFDGAVSYFFQSVGTKLRAHIGNGYRVPSLYERFGTFFNTFTFPDPPRFEALGDPGLKPEKTIAFDAGVEQYLLKDRVRLSATYFYTKLNRTIGFSNSAPDIGSTTRSFGGYINTNGGIARGAEFSAKLRPTASTDIFASYTYTN